MSSSYLFTKINSLSDELKEKVNSYIDSLLLNAKKKKKETKKSSGRGYGSMKGQIKMSKDFDEPLDDFKEYMY